MKKLLIFFIAVIIALSCHKQNQLHKPAERKSFSLLGNLTIFPKQGLITKGKNITVYFHSKSHPDSIKLYLLDTLRLTVVKADSLRYEWNSANSPRLGTVRFTIIAYKKGKSKTFSKAVRLLSDTKPKIFTYKIKKIFPHDPQAYTQGLVYDNGVLYEATGLKGESSIRKVNLNTGQVLMSYSIPADIFGEGITIWQDKLIQLSWKARRGFVYDKHTFQKIGEFSYPTEGWGLTHNENYLIMSDGTNRLYFLDPNTYFVTKVVEVYDDQKPVKLLNELEFINGKLFANIYTTDKIAIIDINSGKVEAYIDMSGLLTDQDRRKYNVDVLNGIAYDHQNGRIFVTGKLWPKLFWIELIEKH